MLFMKRYGWVFSIWAMLGIIGFTATGFVAYAATETSTGGIILGAFTMFVSALLVLFWTEYRMVHSDQEALNLENDLAREIKALGKHDKVLKELRTLLGVSDDGALVGIVRGLQKFSQHGELRIATAEADAKRKVERELKAAQELAETRGEQLKIHKQRNHELELAVSSRKEELRVSEAQISQWQGQIGQLTFFRDLSTKLTEEKAELELRVSALDVLLAAANVTIDELKTQLRETEEKCQRTHTLYSEAKSETRALAEEIERRNSDITRLQTELSTLRAQLSKAQGELRETGTKLSTATNELAELSLAHESLNERSTALASQNELLVLRNSQLELRIQNVDNVRSTGPVPIVERSAQLETSLAGCKAELAAAEARVEESTQVIAELRQLLEAKRLEVQDLCTEVIDVRTSLDETQVALAEANARLGASAEGDVDCKTIANERDRLMRVFEILAEQFPAEVEKALQSTE